MLLVGGCPYRLADGRKIVKFRPGELRRDAERWLRRRGLPHLIEDYSARTDVFTRMTPFLVLVFFGEMMFAFGDRFRGWAQAGAAVLFAGVLIGTAAGVNRLRGRRVFQLPDRVGFLELAAFVMVPALLTMLSAVGRVVDDLASVILLNLTLLAVGYVVVSYGLLPMLWWGLEFMVDQTLSVFRLMARSLPLLLLFAAFFFLNTEMWQVAANFTLPLYWAVLGLIAAGACGFLIVQIPGEVASLERFSSWEEVRSLAAASDSPLADLPPGPHGEFRGEPLSRRAALNIGLLMFVGQTVRVALAGAVTGVFFVVFGLLAVRRTTIEQWLDADQMGELAAFPLFGAEVVLTMPLLLVAGFIAAFSGLQFAVASITDAVYRERFFSDIAAQLREVLAVRRLYLTLPEDGPAPPVSRSPEPG